MAKLLVLCLFVFFFFFFLVVGFVWTYLSVEAIQYKKDLVEANHYFGLSFKEPIDIDQKEFPRVCLIPIVQPPLDQDPNFVGEFGYLGMQGTRNKKVGVV
jgi:hypothetical protein